MIGLIRDIVFNGLAPSVIEEVSDTLTYIGYIKVPSDIEEQYKEGKEIWAIKKIEKIGTKTTIKWAEGTQSFNKKWSLRTSYTYKY